MTKIIEIQTALPAIKNTQEEIALYMQNVYEKSFAVKQVYADTKIAHRYSVLHDFKAEEGSTPFFMKDKEPPMQLRMQKYFEHAPALAMEAIRKLEGYQGMTHLITVSCTGLAAPGLETMIQEELGLSADLQKATVNFMGCYAAIHGLRLADWIIKAEPEARVVLVCVELCTLHFQRNYTLENLSSSSLFSDGAAAVMLAAAGEGLTLKHFFSSVDHSSKQDMGWDLDANGFLMTLSRDVPTKIQDGLRSKLQNRFLSYHLALEDIPNYAIHPGGKRILEAVQESLSLTDEQMESSFHVLENYGNMSSPSILFVIKEEWEQKQPNKLMALAFGPGLTMEGAYLER